jgi:hypothetical protein
MSDDLDIPDFLKRRSTAKVGPKEQAIRDLKASAGTPARPFNPYAAEHAAQRKAKTQARIATLKAKLSGVTAAMPLEGKAALAKIAEASASAQPKETKMTTEPAAAPAVHIDDLHKSDHPIAKANARSWSDRPGQVKKRKTAKAAPKAKGASVTAARGKGPKKPAKRTSAVAAGSKTALIVEMLKRKDGCTTKEVLAATGWPSVSMPAQARLAGLKLRKEKDGAVTRYFAN